MNPEEVRRQIKQIGGAKMEELARSAGLLPSKTREILQRFITIDKDMLRMKQEVEYLSDQKYPILILGESGTGKEIIAEALHGDRAGKFVPVNCTSLPAELLESELFGHRKGTFTGADTDKVGLFEHAINGTIFLDEIGDMPLLMQAKLLRAIQSMSIRRLGENSLRPINCRIVSATWRALPDEHLFRMDLFYRLASYVIKIKPLRERLSDVLEILDEKLDPTGEIIENCVREAWSNHHMDWKGNVRQLENYVLANKIQKEVNKLFNANE